LHYAFASEFCAPAKGNEKGGVEGGVKYVRRNTLTPILDVADLSEVDRLLEEWMARDDERVVIAPDFTVGVRWQAEAPILIPRPRHAFDAGRPLARKVSAYSLVSFRTNLYSVPVEHVGATVMVKCYAQRLEIHGRNGLVASHERLYGRNETSFQLEHYLPLLAWKTRAFDHAAPVRAAQKDWPPAYDLFLRILRGRLGSVEGTRSFIQLLWLHKYHPADRVHRAVRHALTHTEPSFASVLAHLDGVRRAEQPRETIAAERLQQLPQGPGRPRRCQGLRPPAAWRPLMARTQNTSPVAAQVETLATELRLPTVRRMYSRVPDEVARVGGDYVAYLATVLREEVEQRRVSRIERRMQEARLPQPKLLSDLDFSTESMPTKPVVMALAGGQYIRDGTNVICLGNPGTGKDGAGPEAPDRCISLKGTS
jgi:hypothetical protein